MTVSVMSVLLAVGMLLTGSTVLVILMDNHDNSCREFAVFGLFCSFIMLFSYFMELNAAGFGAKIMAIKFGYVGRVFINPMLFMLAVRYYELHISKLMQGAIYLIPVLTLMLVFTCDSNTLYYKRIEMEADGLISIVPGPFYAVYMGYSTVLALIYLMVCLYVRVTLNRREKRTNSWLISSCLFPLFTLLIYLAGWTNGFDTSSLGVMFGSITVTIAIFRFGLLNKEEMLESMATGLIFLGSDNQLVYANKAAMRILPELAKQKRGHMQDLSVLCSDEFDSIQVGSATYQRRMDDWSSGDGEHGKLITFDDITEIRARLNRDAMTGLLNHATFYPMLDSAQEAAVRDGGAVSVSIADIDSFKRINDTYGHANGDIILIALADTLSAVCGTHGDVFRYGGEEFAVIFSCPAPEAERYMQAALDRFSSQSFDFMTGHATFSYGTAEYDGRETSVLLFERADQIMYARKRAFHEAERAAFAANGIAAPEDSRL